MRIHPIAGLLALAGAVLMPVSLFLDWYELEEGATGDNARIPLDGWDVFEATDALMVLLAVATLAVVVFRPLLAGRALLVTGALMAGWIVVQLVDRPAVLGFVGRSALSLEIGAWLGLLGALLIMAAGALARRPARP